MFNQKATLPPPRHRSVTVLVQAGKPEGELTHLATFRFVSKVLSVAHPGNMNAILRWVLPSDCALMLTL